MGIHDVGPLRAGIEGIKQFGNSISRAFSHVYYRLSGQDPRVMKLVGSFHKYYTLDLDYQIKTHKQIVSHDPSRIKMDLFCDKVAESSAKSKNYSKFMRELVAKLPEDGRAQFLSKAHQKWGADARWQAFIQEERVLQPFKQPQKYAEEVKTLKKTLGEEGFLAFRENSSRFIETLHTALADGFSPQQVTVTSAELAPSEKVYTLLTKDNDAVKKWQDVSSDFEAVRRTFGRAAPDDEHLVSINGKKVGKIGQESKDFAVEEQNLALLCDTLLAECPKTDEELKRQALAEMLVVGTIDHNPIGSMYSLCMGLKNLEGHDIAQVTLASPDAVKVSRLRGPNPSPRYEMRMEVIDGKLQCTLKSTEFLMRKVMLSDTDYEEQPMVVTSTLHKDFSNPASDWTGTVELRPH